MNHADQATRTAADRSPAPEGAHSDPSAFRPLILTEAVATRRMLLLAELQAALAVVGVRCVLARNQRLVLQYNVSPCEPSGLTDPKLHIFTPDGTDTATTDGTAYRLATGPEYLTADPAAAAAAIRRGHRAGQQP